MSGNPTIHANCLVLGEAGVLIRGPSGSGKSSLTVALIEHAHALGRFARIVADDRVHLTAHHGRLVATAPRGIAGLIERRGLGVLPAPFLASAVIWLVIDIEDDAPRMPETSDQLSVLEGIALPRLAVMRGAAEAAGLAMAALASIRRRRECVSSALAFEGQDGNILSAAEAPSISRSVVARAPRDGHSSERNEFCAETQ